MIHSNSEGDIYIEEMPLLLVHLREEEKGADARLSEVLSYALDGYAYETATEISAFEDYVNRWRRLEKTQNRKNPVQGRILCGLRVRGTPARRGHADTFQLHDRFQ